MGDGRTGDGSDDYDWLYDKGGRSGESAAEEGDSTRVLPQMGRPEAGERSAAGGRTGAGRPPTSSAPARRLAPTPPGESPPGSRSTGRSGWPHGIRPRPRWILYLLVAWIAYLIIVPVYAWTTVSKVNAFPAGHRPADQPGTNYLVVGSDARKGLPGRRTDTIMLLHTGSGPNLLMSIPRDSSVPIPGHGTTKINASFAWGGPRLLVKTVEQNTGIHIDHYVEIGFRGLVHLVDAVGGITICPKTAMKDPLAHLDIPKGCQHADGRTALGYARSRHTSAIGDIGRAEHQREVVSALGSKIVSPWTVINPFRYWHVVTSGAKTVRVSKGTGPLSAAEFAYAMTHVNGKNGLTCTVPIADLYVHWDSQRAPRMFKLIRQDRTKDIGHSLCSPSGLP
jgi:LCP family protein required for cell wall assembly